MYLPPELGSPLSYTYLGLTLFASWSFYLLLWKVVKHRVWRVAVSLAGLWAALSLLIQIMALLQHGSQHEFWFTVEVVVLTAAWVWVGPTIEMLGADLKAIYRNAGRVSDRSS